MTRKSLQSRLRDTFLFLGTVLAIAAIARFVHPFLDASSTEGKIVLAVYEYLRDMALLIATGGVAYLTNVFQKRSSFIDSLKEEWRDVLHAKSALLNYTHQDAPTAQQYHVAFNTLSETIDNMRTVYRNVGETHELVGLYPYEPLHDMRRAFQTLQPAAAEATSKDRRKLVRDAILQAFYSLRERFLEELDLEEPATPLLVVASRRRKRTGAAAFAERYRLTQTKRQNQEPPRNPVIDELLRVLKDKEANTPKPWRDVPPGSDRPAAST